MQADVRESLRALVEPKVRKDVWSDLLLYRKRVRADPDEDELEAYTRRVEEDRTALKRKFFPEQPRRIKHSGHVWTNPMTPELVNRIADVAPNDTGLPAAHITKTSAMLEKWCKEGSWVMCGNCKCMHMRHLKEIDLRRVAPPTMKSCRFCKDPKFKVPQHDDVTRRLRGLAAEVVQALRPVTIDCGPYERAEFGHRIKTSMTRLSWADTDVREKILKLSDRSLRKQARTAFKELQRNDKSACNDFLLRHKQSLRKHPHPSRRNVSAPFVSSRSTALSAPYGPTSTTTETSARQW